MTMFFILILAVVFGGNTYVLYRLWNMIPQGNPLRWLLLGFVVVAVGAFFAAMLVGDSLPVGMAGFLYRLGTSWFFIVAYFVILFLVLDIARLCGAPLHRYMFGSWPGFIGAVGIVAIIMAAGNIVYHTKKRVELPVEISKPVPDGGLKIVALTDLHLGYGIGKGELARWVGLINAQRPDIVLIAGDVIDNSVRPLFERDFASLMRKIDSKYGVYASLGNHEYISGVDSSLDFLRSAGVQVLRDSAALIGGSLYVVGRDDRMNRDRKPLEQLTADLDRSKPVIVLDHQPYDLDEVELAGADIQISGHTHRGQVWPVTWVTDAIYEKSHGYIKKGAANVYVSSGIGIWGGKYRIGSRSEYVVITLTGR